MPADPKRADQHEEVCAHRDEHRRLRARDGVSHRDAHQPDHVREHERLGSPLQCFPRVARTVDMLDRSIEREREKKNVDSCGLSMIALSVTIPIISIRLG